MGKQVERRLASALVTCPKERAKILPQGKQRVLLARKTRQLETALHISE